ncbi:uncharacterized protein LOC119350968 [Triticum dicoccoides]|uniref:uncharacterized protein LOC119350968 n=1 Tax=Triticum dicoccoides TaxID=85692 RepID=UPI00188F0440|nr:uncharacterized protein LOC119350968 [Triticum dicoccoides]
MAAAADTDRSRVRPTPRDPLQRMPTGTATSSTSPPARTESPAALEVGRETEDQEETAVAGLYTTESDRRRRSGSIESARAMAALRHAARRALQQGGAQVRPSVVAEGPRRLLLNGASPGRRRMSTSSISGKPTSSAELELLEMRFKKTKEELFDLLVAVKRAELYPQLSWEDIQTHRLITHLAAQVEPRPHDPNWRMFRRTRRLNDFNTITVPLGYFGLFAYCVATNMREDGATSKNSEANFVSEPENDMN